MEKKELATIQLGALRWLLSSSMLDLHELMRHESYELIGRKKLEVLAYMERMREFLRENV